MLAVVLALVVCPAAISCSEAALKEAMLKLLERVETLETRGIVFFPPAFLISSSYIILDEENFTHL